MLNRQQIRFEWETGNYSVNMFLSFCAGNSPIVGSFRPFKAYKARFDFVKDEKSMFSMGTSFK